MSATIALERGPAVAPGARLRGQVSWKLGEAPKRARLRLLYSVSGGGAEDQVEVLRDLEVAGLPTASRGDPYRGPASSPRGAALAADEARAFELELPASPYSFTGRLVTIAWRLELLLEPGGVAESVELVLSPTAAAIAPESP